MGKGWIYQYHYHGFTRGDGASLFRDCIYELPLRYMIKNGFLVPPERLDMPIVQYDFSRLEARSNGLFSEADLNRELKRQNRVTPHIISQIVEYAEDRKGVMIFAATVEHAREIHGLLPTGEAALVSAETPAAERDALIEAFKQQRLRYLVNVAVLTTGFDAPHVDLIAILRPTESVSLYQQIVGRGLRLAPGKEDCLILDYAGNPHDLFTPEVGVSKPHGDSQPVQVFCPACGFANLFWGKCTENGDIIEHYGRRCQGWLEDDDGHREQCDYRFRFKSCPHCGAENDIAARLPSVPGGSGRSRRHAESGAEAERRAGAALRRHGAAKRPRRQGRMAEGHLLRRGRHQHQRALPPADAGAAQSVRDAVPAPASARAGRAVRLAHRRRRAGATAGAAPSGFRGGAQTRAVLAGARESVRLSRPFPPRQSIGLSQLSPTWAGFRCPAGGFPLKCRALYLGLPSVKAGFRTCYLGRL